MHRQTKTAQTQRQTRHTEGQEVHHGGRTKRETHTHAKPETVWTFPTTKCSRWAVDQDFEDGKMICHGFKNPLKRQKLDPPPDPPPDSKPVHAKAKPNSVDTTLLRGEEAQQFVEKQVESGKWIAIQALVSRTGFDHSIYGKPDGSGFYEFIIPGSEKTTFEHKNCIKSAGYDHYSENERGGWKKTVLVHNGKTHKAFGKCVNWTYKDGTGGRR